MGMSILSDEIRALLAEADFVHVNLENPITDKPFRPDKKGAALKGPAELSRFLVSNKISICNLANNHVMDCGKEGLEDTIRRLEEARILYYGVGKHLYLVVDYEGTRVALIASAHREGPMGNAHGLGPYYLSQQEITELVRHVKFEKSVDFVVYNFHGGTEFNLVPEPRRRAFFHKLIQCGVDVVVGHHAHVPQGYERLGDGIIFYGLGNFLFDLPYHGSKAFTNVSFLLKVDFERGRKIRFEQHYYLIDREKGQVILFDKERESLQRCIDKKVSVFKSEEQYQRAWLEEAFRVYLFNAPAYGDVFGCCVQLQKARQRGNLKFFDRLVIWARLAKRAIRDITKAHKRPFLMASVRRMFRYGLSDEV